MGYGRRPQKALPQGTFLKIPKDVHHYPRVSASYHPVHQTYSGFEPHTLEQPLRVEYPSTVPMYPSVPVPLSENKSLILSQYRLYEPHE